MTLPYRLSALYSINTRNDWNLSQVVHPFFLEEATPERIRTFSSPTSLANITSKGHVCFTRDNQPRVYENESVVSMDMSFGHRTLFANSHLSSQSQRRRSYAGGVTDFWGIRSTSRLNGLMSIWNRVATPRELFHGGSRKCLKLCFRTGLKSTCLLVLLCYTWRNSKSKSIKIIIPLYQEGTQNNQQKSL